MHQVHAPNCNIRSATLADAPPVAALLRGLGWFTFINDESPVQTERRVAEHLSMCLVDDSEGVVGYVAVHWLPYLMLAGPEGYVSELFVADSARGSWKP